MPDHGGPPPHPPTVNSNSKTVVFALIIGAYLGGYAAIRANCTPMVSKWTIVPACIHNGSPQPLYYLYKPLFFLERQLTGQTFGYSPWAVPDL